MYFVMSIPTWPIMRQMPQCSAHLELPLAFRWTTICGQQTVYFYSYRHKSIKSGNLEGNQWRKKWTWGVQCLHCLCFSNYWLDWKFDGLLATKGNDKHSWNRWRYKVGSLNLKDWACKMTWTFGQGLWIMLQCSEPIQSRVYIKKHRKVSRLSDSWYFG